MVVYPKQIEKHLRSELPFMATEKILMEAVEKGKSRQEMHEVVKEHSVISGKRVKIDGLDNDLFSRLAADDRIPFSLAELEAMTDDLSQYTGRASQQTIEFLDEIVRPLLKKYEKTYTSIDASLNV
jgi:adenylosuccinate lyase